MKQMYLLAASLLFALTSVAQNTACFTFGRAQNANALGEGFLVGQNFDIYTPDKPIVNNDITLSFAKVGEDNNTTTSNTGAFRWFNGTQMTITPASGLNITKVVMTCANASSFQYVVEPQNISNTGKFTIDTTTDSANPTITWEGNSNKPLVWEPKPLDPAIEAAGGKQQNQIRIKNMVVTFEGGIAYEVANIAEFLAKADAVNANTITGAITLVWKSGNFTFWQDASGAMITRGGSFPSGSIKNGSVFKGVAAKYLKVQNLPGGDGAVIPAEFTAGDPVEPKAVTPEEFQSTPYSTYVELKGVHVGPKHSTAKYQDVYYGTDEESNKVTLYDQYNLFVGKDGIESLYDCFAADKTYDVIGFVGSNSQGVRQYWPVEIKEAAGEVNANEVANIAEFLAKADSENLVTITGEITFVYKSSSFTMWKDASGSMITRGGSFPSGSMKNGSVFKGVAAKYLKVKNIPGGDGAVIPAEFTAGDPVAPEAVTPVQFQTAPYATYVTISDVHVNPTVFDATKTNIDLFSDAACSEENKVILLDSFALYGSGLGSQFKVGYNYTVTGFVGANSQGVRQFWPIEITETGTVDDPSGIDNIEADGNAPVEYFNLQGVRVANPQQGGVYIMRQGQNVTKVIK